MNSNTCVLIEEQLERLRERFSGRTLCLLVRLRAQSSQR